MRTRYRIDLGKYKSISELGLIQLGWFECRLKLISKVSTNPLILLVLERRPSQDGTSGHKAT